MSCSHGVQRTALSENLGRPRTIVTTDEDYELDKFDSEVQAVGFPDGETGITLTLPDNPLIGQRHRLVAAVGTITVDGNGNEVAGNLVFIPNNHAAEYSFVVTDECSCGAGKWVPLCCPTVVPPPPVPG